MKTVFLFGLLAVSTAAFNRYSSDYETPLRRNLPFSRWSPTTLNADYEYAEEPTEATTKKPFPLPYEFWTIWMEIQTFGGQMIAYSLNLKNFKCISCFPFKIRSYDIVDILAVKALLHKIYGTEFDHLVEQGPVIYIAKQREESIDLRMDIIAYQRELLNSWNDIWFALENKTFEKHKNQRSAQFQVTELFSMTFDIEITREAKNRFLQVFGPGLNRTTAVQRLVRAVRSYEQPETFSRALYEVSYDGIPHKIEQKQLVEKIHTFLRRMYTYVYNLDPLGEDYMTGYIKEHLKGFSIKSLLVFDNYLEKTFGQAMSEILEKPQSSAEERKEKVQIVRELKDMMTTTLNVWQKDLTSVMQKDVEFHKDYYSKDYKKMFEDHANILADFLSLEDLRRVLRKAMPILGWAKKGIIITEGETYY